MDKPSTSIRTLDDDIQRGLEPNRPGRVENVAAFVGQKAEDATSYVGHKAEDAASYVGHKAEDAASYAGEKAGDASAAVGSGLRSLGQTVRDRGPEDGIAGDASSAVANAMESSGRYLQEEGVKDMAEDVTNLIRRNPIPALLIGVAAGFLVGRAMTPRS
jgi:ElaB/YqjD/DUF883 family membrane-anchored ribosome-binding protein